MKVVALLLSVALLSGSGPGVVFRIQDPAITESSGLVDLGGLMVTMNDSGGDAVVYALDRQGRTVGRTRYADAVTDVEALAPAGPGTVWVGDLGDNRHVRSSVRVYRVPVGRGDRTVAAPAFELVYPDGSHDAESLFTGPDGRLYVVSKGLFGGRAYVAPRLLRSDRPNRLRALGRVPLFATDAAAVPGTPYVLVRGYGSALLLDVGDWRTLATLDLPEQQQGESLSVGPGDRVRVGSEGLHSEVRQVRLPPRMTRLLWLGRYLLAATSGAGAGGMLGR